MSGTSLCESVQNLAVALDQLGQSIDEAFVMPNSFDFCAECCHDQLVDADALGTCHSLGAVGKLVWDSNCGLLRHAITVSRHHDAHNRIRARQSLMAL